EQQEYRNLPVGMNAQPADDEKCSRDGVGAQSDVQRGPAAIEQQVVKVAAVARKRRDAFPQAANHRKEEIHQGQRGENQRQQPVRTDVVVNAIEIQAEKSDQEAEHGAAGVAHENTGRGKVVGQKTQAGTEQAPGDCASSTDRRRRVHRRVTEGHQRRDTSGDSVRTVEEVESVDENGDEQAGQDRIKNRMVEESKIPLGLAQEKSCAQLRQQANLGAQIEQVVDETGIPDQTEREIEMHEVDRRAIGGDDQTKHDGQHHGHSAHARDRHAVDLQVARLVVNLEINGGAANQ